MMGIINVCKNALNRKENCVMDAISQSMLNFYQKNDALWKCISKIIIAYALVFALSLILNVHVVDKIIKSLSMN